MRRVIAAVVAAATVLILAVPARAGLATYVQQTPRDGYGPGAKVVALTFDDGPDPRWTPQILRILSERRAPGAFFMVGSMASQYPRLVRRVAAAGHGLGGHTWNHVSMRGLSATGWANEVTRTVRLLSRTPERDRAIRCFRPPYHSYDSTVVSRLDADGLTTVTWSIDPQDWRRPGADAIVATVLEELTPGGIVVLHDGGGDRSQTVEALPRIIRSVRARGYRIVPICIN